MTKKLALIPTAIFFNLVIFAMFAPNVVTAQTKIAQNTLLTPQINGDTNQEEASLFDTSKYPRYNIEDDKFFITPIKNITGGTRTTENLRKELSLSGYEAYCASENISIKPQFNTDELITKYLSLYPSGIKSTNLEIASVEKLGATGAEYPIWRNVNDKKFLTSSLEEYFGFKDVYETDPTLSEINSAPINSLVSQKQACFQGWNNLVAQNQACDRLQNPAKCALKDRLIPKSQLEPGSAFTVGEMIGQIKIFGSSTLPSGQQTTNSGGWKKEVDAKDACEALINIEQSEKTKTITGTKTTYRELLTNLTNIPTYLDRAYRIGFIVASIKAKKPVINKLFNFFTTDTKDEAPRDEVLAVAFKLPDIGTNKTTEDESGYQNWDNALDLTRKTLTTKKQQDDHELAANAKRTEVWENAVAASSQSPSSKIYCKKGNTATTSCQNSLPKALVDIINGNAGACESNREIVEVIKDVAGLGDTSDKVGKLFTPDNGGQLLTNLFTDSEYNYGDNNSQEAKTKIDGDSDSMFKSIFNINTDTYPDSNNKTSVDFYLVYPVGFEQEAVEDAVKGAFFTKSQIGTFNNSPYIVNNFELTGQDQSLESSSVGWTYEDVDATNRGDCGIDSSGVNIPCVKKPSIDLKQEPAGIGIIGGKLSWWLRQVQLTLNSRASIAYRYYQSCQTMEDFLLGRCVSPRETGPSAKIGEGSICDVAKKYNIDCNFLKAIYAVETCSGTGIPTGGEIACCNAGGYCGPMQLGGGTVVSISTPKENLDICMEEKDGMDSFELSARWLLIKKWCNFNSAECLASPTPYEWKKEYIQTQGNPNITTREEVEDFILGWYGSTKQVENRDGWPADSTYVDGIMRFLDKGSLWNQCAYSL